MSNEVWKSFEDNEITHSGAHYLMTIKNLLEHQGYARVTDIARRFTSRAEAAPSASSR